MEAKLVAALKADGLPVPQQSPEDRLKALRERHAEPVRGWKIARQTERRRMYPWRGAPNRAFDRSCRTAPTTARRDVFGGR